MIKFRANINHIIMTNLQGLSFAKVHTVSELESLLLKIKMNILESNIDISFKADVEAHMSHENIKVLAEKCHQRYMSDIKSLNVPGFLKKFWTYLIPMAITGLLAFAWLILDTLEGIQSLDLYTALKAAYVLVVLFGSKKLYLKHQHSNRSIYLKESEILRSKIFGLIYENLNSLYLAGSMHAS